MGQDKSHINDAWGKFAFFVDVYVYQSFVIFPVLMCELAG